MHAHYERIIINNTRRIIIYFGRHELTYERCALFLKKQIGDFSPYCSYTIFKKKKSYINTTRPGSPEKQKIQLVNYQRTLFAIFQQRHSLNVKSYNTI